LPHRKSLRSNSRYLRPGISWRNTPDALEPIREFGTAKPFYPSQDHCILEVNTDTQFMCWYDITVDYDDNAGDYGDFPPNVYAMLIKYNEVDGYSRGPVTQIGGILPGEFDGGSDLYCIGNPRAVKIRDGVVAFATTQGNYGQSGADRYKIYGQVITCNADLTMTLPGNTKILESQSKGFYSFFAMETINGDDEFTIIARSIATWDHTSAYGFTVSGNAITMVASSMASNAYWVIGSGWSLETNENNFTAVAATSNVESDRQDIENGETYTVLFTITNYGGGSFSMKIGGTETAVKSGNVSWTEEIVAGATGKIELVGVGFTGRVKTIKVYVCVDDDLSDNSYWDKGDGWTVTGGELRITTPAAPSKIQPATPLKLNGKRIHCYSLSYNPVGGKPNSVTFDVGGATGFTNQAAPFDTSSFIASSDECYIQGTPETVAQRILYFRVAILTGHLSVSIKDGFEFIKTRADEGMFTWTYNSSRYPHFRALLLTQSAGVPTWTVGSEHHIEYNPTQFQAPGAYLEDGKVVVSHAGDLFVFAVNAGKITTLTQTALSDIDPRFQAKGSEITAHDSNTFALLPRGVDSVYDVWFAVMSLDGANVPVLDFAVRTNGGNQAIGGYNTLNGAIGKFTDEGFLVGFPDKSTGSGDPKYLAATYEIYDLDELLIGPENP